MMGDNCFTHVKYPPVRMLPKCYFGFLYLRVGNYIPTTTLNGKQ
jgi:hypothetical protein